MRDLIVTSSANETYFPFVLPYMVSVLHFNPTASIEIFVPIGSAFKDRYAEGLRKIYEVFPDRAVITEVDFAGRQASVIRFVTEPTTKANYVYMGDIDVLILEPISPANVEAMRRFGTRYSNFVRKNFLPDVRRLAGHHFVEFDYYFPVEIPSDANMQDQTWGFDEILLYKLMEAKGPVLETFDFHSMHGFHVSHHGWPLHKQRGWNINNPGFRSSYNQLVNTSEFRAIKRHFDPRYQILLQLIDLSIDALACFSPGELAGNFVFSGRN